MLAGLGGCQGGGAIGSGEGLFHDLQGGVIAGQRPPPPGVNDPFPSLGSIPPRPPAPDIVAEQTLGDRLAAQRDQAERAAEASPITPRPAAPPPPPPAAAPDPNANRVVVDAAPTPPAPKPQSPAHPAAAATPGPASAIPSLASVPAVAAPVASGPLPSLAAAPPPSPAGLGVEIGPATPAAPVSGTIAVAAATPAAAAPPKPAAAAAATPLLDRLFSEKVVPGPVGDTLAPAVAIPPTNAVSVEFTPGSDVLPPSATLNLRRFALAHRGVPVTITGRGGDVLPGAEPQARALDLALRRARAIAASLGTAGVAAANIRLHAEAAGQGGSASL